MTIDEAIEHCKERADDITITSCEGCRQEHAQLAKWLEELKEARSLLNRIYEQWNPKDRNMRDAVMFTFDSETYKLNEAVTSFIDKTKDND